MEDKQDESYKKKRRNYAIANYTAMKRFFNETEWAKTKKLKDVQEKYDLFLMIYEQGVKKYVPFYRIKENGLMENEKQLKRKEMMHGGE